METKQKILIVDDERININVLVDLLRPEYKIMAAISGEQALKAANSDAPPDLILLDVVMPEMNGYEVCMQLKSNPRTKDIPVIFVTGMGQEEDETKGLEVGAVDYLTKPISPPIVLARVKTQLALRKSMLELKSAYALIESQKERMQDELNIGRTIQMSMLRQDFPAYPERKEFSLAATIMPAREVGGDFYDFFFFDKDRLCLCVGDVSGKGVPAALFMAVSKTLIRSRALSDASPASVMTFTNDSLCEGNDSCMFVTMFFATLNLKTGELIYCNAGHNPPNIKKANGEVIRLTDRHGLVAGAIDGMAYGESTSLLQPGDLLVLFTDGVTEAMNPNGELYSEDRLESLLASKDFPSSQELNEIIIKEVKDFEEDAGQADDITILSLLFAGSGDVSSSKVLNTSIRNELSEVGGFLDMFESFAEKAELGMEVSTKVAMAFDELLANTISYGYPDELEHIIDIHVEIHSDHLSIVIKDDGIPFNPFTMKDPDTKLSIEEREIGG